MGRKNRLGKQMAAVFMSAALIMGMIPQAGFVYAAEDAEYENVTEQEEAIIDASEEDVTVTEEDVKASDCHSERREESLLKGNEENPEAEVTSEMAAEEALSDEMPAEEDSLGLPDDWNPAESVKIGKPSADIFSANYQIFKNGELDFDETHTSDAYIEYKNGVLTIRDFEDTKAGVPLGDNSYACLYADGDLIVEFTDDKTWFDTAPGNGWAKVYGIYVTGNLILRNKSGELGKLATSDGNESAGSVSNEAMGVYCGKNLTIEEQKDGDDGGFTADIHVGNVKGNSVRNSGIYANDEITINSGVITIDSNVMKAGGKNTESAKSYGIFAGNGLTVEDGSINVSSADIQDSNGKAYTYGIYVDSGNLMINGGNIETKAGDSDSSSRSSTGNSDGIYAGGHVTVNGGLTYATGGALTGTHALSIGFYQKDAVEIR